MELLFEALVLGVLARSGTHEAWEFEALCLKAPERASWLQEEAMACSGRYGRWIQRPPTLGTMIPRIAWRWILRVSAVRLRVT